MRVEDPEQGPDREVFEGTGASSSRDGAGHEQEAMGTPVAMSEPQPRPAEPSVGEEQPPREQSDDADMADPDSDRRRPSLMVKTVMNGWRPKGNGCEFTVVPDEIYSLPTTLRVGPESIDISKRRESIVCSTGEGEWRARVKSTGIPVAGETRRRLKICLKSGQEAQDSESLGVEVLYDYESENHQHRETCGSDNEQTQATGRRRLLAGCERWHP